MDLFMAKNIREIGYDIAGINVTIRMTRHYENDMHNIFLQAFADGEDKDPPGISIGVSSEVMQQFEESEWDVVSTILSEMEDCYFRHYLDRMSKEGGFKYESTVTEQVRETQQHSGSDNGKLPSEIAAQNGLGS